MVRAHIRRYVLQRPLLPNILPHILVSVLLATGGCAPILPNSGRPAMKGRAAAAVGHPSQGSRRYASQVTVRRRQRCHAGHTRSCYLAGVDYERGRGVKSDLELAAEYYRRACDVKGGGKSRSCPSKL